MTNQYPDAYNNLLEDLDLHDNQYIRDWFDIFEKASRGNYINVLSTVKALMRPDVLAAMDGPHNVPQYVGRNDKVVVNINRTN